MRLALKHQHIRIQMHIFQIHFEQIFITSLRKMISRRGIVGSFEDGTHAAFEQSSITLVHPPTKKLWCWKPTVLTRGLSISSVGEKWAQQSTSGRDVTSLPAVRRGLCYRLLPASNALPLVVRAARRSAASPMENQVWNRHTCAVDRKWSSSLSCVVATILWVWR